VLTRFGANESVRCTHVDEKLTAFLELARQSTR